MGITLLSQQSHRAGRAKCTLVLLCVVVAICLFCGCTQQQDQIQKEPEYKSDLIQSDTLKVLIAPDRAPFAAGSGEGVWGYDIAVAQEIANRLDLQLEFIEEPRNDLLSILACEPVSTDSELTDSVSTESAENTGSSDQVPAKESAEPEVPEPQGDIALATLAFSSESNDAIDFTNWYYVADQSVVTLKDIYNSTTEFDRTKTRIAVVKDSTCLATAESLTDAKLVAEYSTAEKCLEALRAKEVQAVVLDLPIAKYLIENGFSDMRILEYLVIGETYRIAVPKTSARLKDAINETLLEMEEDGTMDRLASEYL